MPNPNKPRLSAAAQRAARAQKLTTEVGSKALLKEVTSVEEKPSASVSTPPVLKIEPTPAPVVPTPPPLTDPVGEGECAPEFLSSRRKQKKGDRLSVGFTSEIFRDLKALAWIEDKSDAMLIREAVQALLITKSAQVKQSHELQSLKRQSA